MVGLLGVLDAAVPGYSLAWVYIVDMRSVPVVLASPHSHRESADLASGRGAMHYIQHMGLAY